MRVIATTVVRESIRGKQRTGTIYDVDWDSGAVSASFPVPEPDRPENDANPRGGSRGGRGAAAIGENVVIANYDTLLVYDRKWTLVDRFTHPLFLGLHELDWDGDRLYAAATAIDAVLAVDVPARTVEVAWDPHNSPLARRFGISRGRKPPLLDAYAAPRKVDQVHLNGVTCIDDGLVVNCGLVRPTASLYQRQRRRVVTRLGKPPIAKPRGAGVTLHVPAAGDEQVLVELSSRGMPTHNGQQLPGGRIAINDSSHDTLRIFSARGAREELTIPVNGTWLRGLEPLDQNRVLVGTAPASIVMINLEQGVEMGRVALSENPDEVIHGLVRVPDSSNSR